MWCVLVKMKKIKLPAFCESERHAVQAARAVLRTATSKFHIAPTVTTLQGCQSLLAPYGLLSTLLKFGSGEQPLPQLYKGVSAHYSLMVLISFGCQV